MFLNFLVAAIGPPGEVENIFCLIFLSFQTTILIWAVRSSAFFFEEMHRERFKSIFWLKKQLEGLWIVICSTCKFVLNTFIIKTSPPKKNIIKM